MSGNNRPSIVFLNHWAKSLGGAEHSLLDILTYMTKEHTCHLVTSEDGELVKRAKALGVVCHIIPCTMKQFTNLRKHLFVAAFSSLPELFTYCKFVFQIRSLILKISPTVIHANIPKSHITLCLLTILGYKGDSCFHIREIFLKHSAPVFLYALLFPHKNTRIIAISEAVKKALPIRLQKKSHVIYNGISIPKICPTISVSKNNVNFLYLGRIVPWKGCHLLLDYFSQLIKLNKSNTDIQLSLVGDTIYWSQDYRNDLHTIIREKNLDSCCCICAHTNDVEHVLQNHNVFVNASESEPFGRSLAEAQGAGLPVIAFDSGGVREIVENNVTGILVPQNDGQAFVKAMIACIENPSLVAAMGKEAHTRAKLLFNREIQMVKIGMAIAKKKS